MLMDKDYALKKSKRFCMLPWTHLHSWPDGRVLPCCMAPMDEILGNLKDQTFEDIWNSDKLKKMRVAMIEDKPTKECTRCYEHEEKGLEKDFGSDPSKMLEDIGKPVRQMPQIKIDDELIGGYNQLVEYFEKQGKVNFKGEIK